MFAQVLLSAALAGLTTAQVDLEFTSQGHFKQKHAAFINLGKFDDSEEFLLISEFSGTPGSAGKIHMVEGVTDAVKAGNIGTLNSVRLDTINYMWPNNIEAVPQSVFGERAIVVPDGFLVPTKTNGGIYIVRMDDTDLTKTKSTVKISQEKDGYFYHMGFWVDLNQDGRLDYITARSNAKAGEGELVWLEHPEDPLDAGVAWPEHIIGNVADVSISIETLPEY